MNHSSVSGVPHSAHLPVPRVKRFLSISDHRPINEALETIRGFRCNCFALGLAILFLAPTAHGKEGPPLNRPPSGWGLRGRIGYGFTRISGTDLATQDTAELLSRSHLMGDLDAVWNLSSRFRPFIGFQTSALSFLPSSDIDISPGSLFLWGIRGGADWILLPRLRLQPALFWGHQPYIGASTSTTLPITGRSVPGGELTLDWLMSQRGAWINGFTAHARYLMGSKGTEFDVQSGMGYGARFYSGLQLSQYLLRVGVSYSTISQNTSLLSQKTLTAGLDIGLEYRFPKPRSDSRRESEAPTVRVLPIQKQGTVQVRVTRMESGKSMETKTLPGTWKWGRYNEIPCMEVDFDVPGNPSKKLCLTRKTTLFPSADGRPPATPQWRLELPFEEPTILVSSGCERLGVVVESSNLRGRFGIIGIHCLPNGEERITPSPGIRILSDSNGTEKEVLYFIRSKEGSALGKFQILRP